MPRPKVRPENRQRSDRACLACKASKIRCDAQQPCSTCIRRDQAHACTYSVDHRRRSNLRVRSVTAEAVSQASHSPDTSVPSTSQGSGLQEGRPPLEANPSLGPLTTAVYVGETSSLSFLHFLRRTIKGYIGSVPFTDAEGHHVAIEPDSVTGAEIPPASPERICSLLDSYSEVTSGVLDLFTGEEIDRLMAERQKGPPAHSSKDTAALDLALSIGAQARGSRDDLLITKGYFLRARAVAFDGMLMSQDVNTVRLFTLLAFRMLGACNRNAATMYLGIATKAAVILGLHQAEDDSFILGRPRSLPVISQGISPTQFDPSPQQLVFTAMVKACILLANIVDTLSKSTNILHIPTAELLLERLRQWSRELPLTIRRFPDTSHSPPPLQPTQRQALLGSIHISCVYYYAVILITRPFLVAYLMSRLHGKAPDHLISDPDEASDINLKNNKVSRLAQVCVSAAISMIDTCIKAKACHFIFGNLCLLEAWIFCAGLVLGFSMFAGEPRHDIQTSFEHVLVILSDIAACSPQAKLYHKILGSFADAVEKYHQRVVDEMQYTVQGYMDRVLVFESAGGGLSEWVNNDYADAMGSGEAWSELGMQLQFLDGLVPELEPFDRLFCGVE
ncbi:hypothetical protein BO78DRAFT_437872 [Aspergillus sclerotiicarbonarius CBS 121057]|uniref:Zn(2)-C6 fungal-type domain-containing protein n=1 Tax=Aspergillus sclerotiicarbonarius (strain CBS 121057 / IBT 28362) TaxID=1448318 RepID=A0A319DSH4_ASPSB|nr:hypothetical protein BO78DRAFT_437872 [Aspergillus sclerotiicarbonarius CBS 121057]